MPARPAADPTATGRPPVPHRLATTLLALVLPLAVLAVGVALALAWRADLPDPVASHWPASGGPDGSSSFAATLALLVAVVVPFTVAMWLLGLLAGRTAGTRRTVAFLGAWFAVTMCGIIVGSLAVQRGLTDWRQTGGLGGVLAVAFAAATVFGALAAVATPRDAPQPTTAPVPADAPRLRLAGTAGARWSATVAMARPGIAAGAAVVLLVVLGALTRTWVPALVTALVLAAAGTMLRWTVTVDERGLTARPALSWPRVAVPLDEVLSAEAVEVDPFRDFGGWGYRIGAGGRVGIVLRRGEALVVHRTGGRELAVTVDGAARGAALLNTLAARSR